MSGPATGRHIGQKLADLMHDARVSAGSRLIQAETDHRAAYHKFLMEDMESGMAERARAVFAETINSEGMPQEVKALFEPLLGPEHQSDFLFGFFVLLGAVFTVPSSAAAGIAQQARNEALSKRPTVPIPPEALAVMVLKGIIQAGEAHVEAKYSGVEESRMDLLTAAAGEPPGLMQLLEAYRRGFIDEGRLDRGIRQSRVRDEWTDVVTKLRFAPPSAQEAIAAAVQGHLSDDQAKEHMTLAGLDPVNYPWLYETAGRPPGTQEMLQLLNRGAVSEAEVTAAIRESDVKNKYIPAILKMREHLLPQRSIVSMLRHGALTDAQATTALQHLGIGPENVHALITEAHAATGTQVRELSAAETVDLYTEGLIDTARAIQMLEALRYNEAAALDLLHLADVKREHAAVSAAVRRVGSAYVGHKIDRTTASTRLDALGMDVGARDQAVKLWDEERQANRRNLTEAQVTKAWKAGKLDDAGFVDRHVQMGYTPGDAQLLLALDKG